MEPAAEVVWAEVAAAAVPSAPFWPLRRLPPADLSDDDRRTLEEAAQELAARSDRDLFVGRAPELAQACLLTVPRADAAAFVGAMRSWQRDHGSLLSERWSKAALRAFDFLVEGWSAAAEAQASLWPDEEPIPRPPDRAADVLRWVESKQRERRVELGPLLLDVSDDDAVTLARRCLPLLGADRALARAAEHLLLALACWTTTGVAEVQHELLERGVLYPGVLYRDAAPGVAELLLHLVEQGEHRNHTLLALAWTADPLAVEQFAAWRAAPPAWASDLHLPAHAYATEAGWCIDTSGQRRDLCARSAVELVPQADDEPGPPVATFRADPMSCPWCGDALTTVFDLDLARADLAFLDLPRGRLRVITCERCTAYGHVHSDVDLEGGARWSPDNVRPSFVAEGEWVRVPRAFGMGRTRRTTVETLALAHLGHRSQLGGHPSWDQHAAHPRCPRCGEPMPFLGQIDFADVEELGEGMLYAFFDATCLTAATTYQQT